MEWTELNMSAEQIRLLFRISFGTGIGMAVLLAAAVGEFIIMDIPGIYKICTESMARKGNKRKEGFREKGKKAEKKEKTERAEEKRKWYKENGRKYEEKDSGTLVLREEGAKKIGKFVIETDILMIYSEENV